MVNYIRIGDIEYVMREGESCSVDDPVGEYLFKRFQKGYKGRINLEDGKFSYEEALELFETGKMTREDYESLLKKVKPKSLTQRREESIAATILNKRELMGNLFGEDRQELSEEEKRKLFEMAGNITIFRKFLKPYIQRRMDEDFPSDYFSGSDYEIIVRSFPEGKSSINDLEKRLITLRIVARQHIGWNSGDKLKYPENKELSLEYSRVLKQGSVFSLTKILKDLSKLLK